jgi:hypothetical protein
MRRDLPASDDDQLDEVESTSGVESAGAFTSDSPSLAFLRDVARASDRSPNTFDVQLAASGEEVAGDAGGPFSSRRFVVRGRLGAGGFGVVYEVFDRERNATVALKAPRRNDGRAIAGFKREFRSLVETMHENLVQLYELHAEGDAWFFTMELVRGEDALAYVRPAGGAYDEARLRAVLRQLAAGLSFLHRSGKLHRDLKPSNVMVTGEGRVVIVDFGLVREIAALPIDIESEGIFGTPAYMAPEQAAGLPVGTAADWYAVGVMLYEALTGRLPVRAARGTPPPSELAAGVPEDLDRLCVDLLARAPERRPTGREVRRRLAPERRGTEAAPSTERRREPSGGGEVHFIGRAMHLGQLREALATADHGAAVVVLLHGRSGMGKSALVQRFLGEVRARAPDRLVLSGRCFEQESVPYKGIDGLIDDLCQRLRERPGAPLPADFAMLARLFPQVRELRGVGARTGDGDGDPLLRPRAFAALRELCAGAAPPAPVLVVDDLQWGDLDSIALLDALLRGQGRAPMLLVISYRAEDVETNPVLGSFFAAIGALEGRLDVRRVEVGALDDHDAESLSRALLVADDRSGGVFAERTVQALVAEAHGDPFLITELTRRDADARPLEDTFDSRGDTAGARVLSVGPLLAARIGRLPEPARRLLEVVALAGQPIARAVAARAAYGSEGEAEALGAIGVLRARRLIRSRITPGGEEILPYHDRIRETLSHGLDPATGREHHHRLALALSASTTAEPERLLFHFRSAGRLGDAARYATDAARRAHEALAFDRAARLFREALALGAEESGLREALADALTGAGRLREAALAYLDAARAAAPAEALGLRRRAAELFLGAGYVDEGLATLRAVLRDLDVDLSASLPRSLLGYAALRVRLAARGLDFRDRPASAVGERELLRIDACYTAALGLFMFNPILAAEPHARHLLLALDAGEPLRVARALGFEAVFSAIQRGTGASTDRLVETARALEQRVAHPHLTGWLRICESHLAQLSAQWRLALECVVEGESVLRRRGSGVSLEIDFARFRRTDILWILGDVAELARVVPALVSEARERGNRFLEMMVLLSTGSILGLIEGRPDRAREAVASTLERWPRAPGTMTHLREIRAEARIALYEGRAHAALAWIEDGLRALRRTGMIVARAQICELRLLGAFAAISIGDVAGAASHTRAFTRDRFSWTENGGRMLHAALRRRVGDLDGAVALLGLARETAHARGEALYEAAMSRRLGEWMGGSEGRARVESANAWMARQGIVDPERLTAMLLGWV